MDAININDDYVAPFKIKTIQNNEIPPIIKQFGYTLDEDRREIFVNFDKNGKTSFFDKDGKRIQNNDDFLTKGAFIEPQSMNIKFNIPCYVFRKEDYNLYLNVQKKLKNMQAEKREISAKEYSIINFIKENEDKSKEMLLALIHESKHLNDEILISIRQLNVEAKKLSIEDSYKLELEKERSASFFEIITAINRYLRFSEKRICN